MEPLEPNDPLWKLLGKGRAVEPRPNFTQNVLRAARQTPQARGWWAVVREWLSDHPSAMPRFVVGAAAAVVLGISILSQMDPAGSAGGVADAVRSAPVPSESQAPVLAAAETPLLAVETQLENIDEVSALLALEDTSSLTDSQISFLLY